MPFSWCAVMWAIQRCMIGLARTTQTCPVWAISGTELTVTTEFCKILGMFSVLFAGNVRDGRAHSEVKV